MYSDIQEIRALLLQFDRSALKDVYLKAGDWAVFMARPDGAGNPMLAAGPVVDIAASVRSLTIKAPHLGMFAPARAPGDVVESGAVIGVIDVLGRQTEVRSEAAGTIVAIGAAALVEYDEALAELEAAA